MCQHDLVATGGRRQGTHLSVVVAQRTERHVAHARVARRAALAERVGGALDDGRRRRERAAARRGVRSARGALQELRHPWPHVLAGQREREGV